MANRFVYQDKTFHIGDTIKVYQKIQEDEKIRLQIFEGILMAIRGSDVNQSFRVRKISSHLGIGIERIWPVHTPSIDKIVLQKRGTARRAKLYYLRGRVGKQALQTKAVTPPPAPKSPPPAKKPVKKKVRREKVIAKPQL